MKRGFYLFGSFLLVFIGIGITINTTGVFIQALSRTRGFTLSSVAFIFSVGALVNMAGAVVVGSLLNRYDHRPVMAVSILLLGGGMMLYAVCDRIWHFYLVALLTGSGTAGSHLIPATMFVTRWFGRNRGLAMGTVLAGNGIGGLVFNPLTQYLIEINPLGTPYGYQSAYILGGAAVIAVLLPTAMLLRLPAEGEGGYKLNPEADEAPSPGPPHGSSLSPSLESAAAPLIHSKGEADGKQQHASLGEALRTGHYWCLAAMMLGVSAVFMGINQHLFGHFTISLGIPPGIASRLVGVMMGMMVPGILLAGMVTDRVGLRASLSIFGLFLIGSLSFLPFVGALGWAVVFVLSYGFFNVIQTVFPPLIVGIRFGETHYPAVFGSLIVAQTLGAAFGPFIIGWVHDRNGSYIPALIGAAAVLAVSISLGWGVAGAGRRRVREAV
ncbi:MAG: MFS transporter [Sediminispirochaetaceae bacterium]